VACPPTRSVIWWNRTQRDGTLGFIGEERVNVLALNLALEQTPAASGSASPTVSDPVGG
jgi:hypothetical protein